WIVIKDPLAALAHQHLFSALDVLKILRAHRDVTHRTAAIDYLGHGQASPAADSLVTLIHAGSHRSADRLLRTLQFLHRFLVGLSPLPTLLLSRFDCGFFCFTLDFPCIPVL